MKRVALAAPREDNWRNNLDFTHRHLQTFAGRTKPENSSGLASYSARADKPGPWCSTRGIIWVPSHISSITEQPQRGDLNMPVQRVSSAVCCIFGHGGRVGSRKDKRRQRRRCFPISNSAWDCLAHRNCTPQENRTSHGQRFLFSR